MTNVFYSILRRSSASDMNLGGFCIYFSVDTQTQGYMSRVVTRTYAIEGSAAESECDEWMLEGRELQSPWSDDLGLTVYITRYILSGVRIIYVTSWDNSCFSGGYFSCCYSWWRGGGGAPCFHTILQHVGLTVSDTRNNFIDLRHRVPVSVFRQLGLYAVPGFLCHRIHVGLYTEVGKATGLYGAYLG